MSSLISFAYFLVFECKIDSNLVAAKYYVGFRFMNMTSFKDVFKFGIKWERILSYIKTVNTCTRQMQYDNFVLIQSKKGKEVFFNQDFLYLFLRHLTKILALYYTHHVGCFLADLKKKPSCCWVLQHTLYLYFVKLYYLTPFRMQNHP